MSKSWLSFPVTTCARLKSLTMTTGAMAFTCALLLLTAGCGDRASDGSYNSGFAGPQFDEVDPKPLPVTFPDSSLRNLAELEEKVPQLPPNTIAKEQYDAQGALIAQGFYCDNLAVGHWVTFFADGKLASAGRYNYGAVKTGLWAYWTPAGQPQMVGVFGDFEREMGIWTYYHANGVISAQGEMNNGERVGSWRAWDDSGRLIQAGSYSNGERIGTWYFWDVDGGMHVMEEIP